MSKERSPLRRQIEKIGSWKARWAGAKDEIPDMLRDGAKVVFFEETHTKYNWRGLIDALVGCKAFRLYVGSKKSNDKIETLREEAESPYRDTKTLQYILKQLAHHREVILASDKDYTSISLRPSVHPSRRLSWHPDDSKGTTRGTVLQTYHGFSTQYRVKKSGERYVVKPPTGTLCVHRDDQMHRVPLVEKNGRLVAIARFNLRNLK